MILYYINYHQISTSYVLLTGPRQANLVLIAYASSEGSGEPARIRAVSPEPSLLA